MTWTVVWRPVAESYLAETWMSSPDRADISRAADDIDNRLRKDPHNQGESRVGDGVRVIVVEPLAALFEISDADRLVTVLKVWRVQER
jgi:hypothetical protein